MKWRIIKIVFGALAGTAFLNMIIEWLLTNHNIISDKEPKIQEWV